MFCYTKPVLFDEVYHVFIAVLRKLMCFCTKQKYKINVCGSPRPQHKGIYFYVIFTQFFNTAIQ